MLARIESRTTIGIKGYSIDVEVDVSCGAPSFSIVGLPDTACRESAKRVISAIKNSNFDFASKKITVNLAPASIKKEGACYDLAIAVGILVACGYIRQEDLDNKVICGELSLDGTVRPISGILPRAHSIEKSKIMIVPFGNLPEASMLKNGSSLGIKSLNQLVSFLNGEIDVQSLMANNENIQPIIERTQNRVDFSDVKGNIHAKRAIEVASAGAHNIILIGPPGAGKTMLARRIPTILDDMNYEEALETAKIHSIAGFTKNSNRLLRERPFRSLHHSASDAGILGGGDSIRPGEISLAHNGVLFLDELPEFRRNVLEALRQPIEEGKILITRVNNSVEYPAKFMLVAAMNPCPCGYLTHPTKKCHCTPPQIQRYLNKVSGPLLDRIDIQIEVPPLKYAQLTDKGYRESSEAIKKRVVEAKDIQKARYKDAGIFYNSQLTPKLMDEFCIMTDEACHLLKLAIQELSLSARAYDRIRKVARTIADLDKKPLIEAEHISEAIGYRCLDRDMWVG